ncbi:N-acetylmuramoyl-L-alanine amidase [Rhodobacteraceae bacterium]|nr:N-acetylmuramoyl-L-alanine amidase [Paracoccaceae bacterium]
MRYLKWPALALNFLLTVCAVGSASSSDINSALARVDAKNSSIDDISWGQVQLQLSLSQGVPYRVYTITEPNRVVLEFNRAMIDDIAMDQISQSDKIDSVEVAVSAAGWSQLILNVKQPLIVFSVETKVPDDGSSAMLDLVLVPVTQTEFETNSKPVQARKAEPISQPATLPSKETIDGKLRIAIDPGHGGIDPGAQVQGIEESDLMLSLARDIKESLLRNDNIEVTLTRVKDIFVSLEERVRLANSFQADIFISLHADAVTEGVARGATVYTLSEEATDKASAALVARHDHDQLISGLDLSGTEGAVTDVLIDLARLDNGPRSKELALSVVSGLKEALGQVNAKPYREAGFSVLKAADIPSILIEAGFMSTKSELQNLQDEAWRQLFAEGVRIGVLNWLAKDETSRALRRQ